MSRNWIAVASAEHVARGQSGGFMQVCHGKAAPLRRLSRGDRVVYYAPTTQFRAGRSLQAFIAIGHVADEVPYQADMGGGFLPFRRNVLWQHATMAPIQPLLPLMELTAGKPNWGYAFRFGLITITDADMGLIACAMNAPPD